MVVMIVNMNVLPTKRKELLQAIYELIPFMRKEKGYCNACIYMDSRDKNLVTLVEEWETQEGMDNYMRSYYFEILQGAMKLLTQSSELKFSKIFQPAKYNIEVFRTEAETNQGEVFPLHYIKQ